MSKFETIIQISKIIIALIFGIWVIHLLTLIANGLANGLASGITNV